MSKLLSPWISTFAARTGAAPIVLVQHEPLGAPKRRGLRGVAQQVALRKVHRQSCVVVTGGSSNTGSGRRSASGARSA